VAHSSLGCVYECANSHANRHRDSFAERDRDEYTDAHRNVNQHTDTDRHRDDYTATERDRNVRAHAHRNRDAHARRTQRDSERGANLRGLDRQKARRHLRDVS